jgi:hypothetical protein
MMMKIKLAKFFLWSLVLALAVFAVFWLNAAHAQDLTHPVSPSTHDSSHTCNLPKNVSLRTAINLPAVKTVSSATTSNNDRDLLLKTYPEYLPFASELVIHHAVPPMVLETRPALFTLAEIHSIVNLRGICLSDQLSVHVPIMAAWVEFLCAHQNASRKEIVDEAARVDKMWGSHFYPAIGKACFLERKK